MKKSTEANKLRIQAIATQLFIDKGASSTSLSDIAKEAGISKGTLYYYYPNKADLIFDITVKHMNLITQDLLNWAEESKDETDPATLLKVVFNKMVGAKRRGKLHLYLIQEAVTTEPSLRERFKTNYRQWREMLEKGLSEIIGPDADAHMLASVLLACLDGLLLQNMLGFQLTPTRKTIDYLLQLT